MWNILELNDIYSMSQVPHGVLYVFLSATIVRRLIFIYSLSFF
jgi:hypothetical protein